MEAREQQPNVCGHDVVIVRTAGEKNHHNRFVSKCNAFLVLLTYSCTIQVSSPFYYHQFDVKKVHQ